MGCYQTLRTTPGVFGPSHNRVGDFCIDDFILAGATHLAQAALGSARGLTYLH